VFAEFAAWPEVDTLAELLKHFGSTWTAKWIGEMFVVT
jgi:hypothetical protein